MGTAAALQAATPRWPRAEAETQGRRQQSEQQKAFLTQSREKQRVFFFLYISLYILEQTAV